MSLNLRVPAVAGQFYPADADALRNEVDRLLEGCPAAAAPVSAVVSPHAGYGYSGRLTALSLASSTGQKPSLLVVLSPSHRHAFEGLALPSQDAFALPGAEIPIAKAYVSFLVSAGLAHIEDAAHEREHGIEVQLPFLHRLHPGVPVLPVVIGQTRPRKVAHLIDAIAAKAKAPLFVLSSDLSHYLPKDAALATDAATAQQFETGGKRLTPEQACGSAALNGYRASQYAKGCRVLRLGMRNSAETQAGHDSRTVGYGAWGCFAGHQPCLSQDLRNRLLRTARQALASRLAKGAAPHIDTGSFPAPLQGFAASFVTLEQQGRLRGCIGSLKAHRPLIEDVAINAQKAALEDWRFYQLPAKQLPHTKLKISVLSPPRTIQVESQKDLEARLVPGRDGLILRDQGRSATFLPSVWEKLADRHGFVQALKRKAGLPDDHWSETMSIELYHAESFGEA